MAFQPVSGGTGIVGYWPAKAADRQVGDEITGVYKQKMERTNPDGSQNVIYAVETSKGLIGVNSSATIAQAMEKIPTGSTVKIVFRGKQRSAKSGREYNNFEVFMDDGSGDGDGVDLDGLDF